MDITNDQKFIRETKDNSNIVETSDIQRTISQQGESFIAELDKPYSELDFIEIAK